MKKNKISNKNIFPNKKVIILLIALFILIITFSSIYFYNNVIVYDYQKVMFLVNGEKVTIEEFNYFINDAKNRIKIKHEENFPETVKKEISKFEDLETLFISMDGKNVKGYTPDGIQLNNVSISEDLKKEVIKLAANYKIQTQNSKKANIKIGSSEQNAISQEIISRKTTGIGTAEYKREFYKNEFGMSSENNYIALAENLKMIEKFKNSITEKMNLENKEINEFYSSNQEKYQGVSYMKVRQLTISIMDKYGKTFNEDIIDKLQKKADMAYERAMKGEDFTKLIYEYSTDETEKKQKGYKSVGEEDLQKDPYTQIIVKRMLPGDILAPLKLQEAIYVLKFEGLGDKEQLKLDTVKEQVKTELANQKYNKLLDEWRQVVK